MPDTSRESERERGGGGGLRSEICILSLQRMQELAFLFFQKNMFVRIIDTSRGDLRSLAKEYMNYIQKLLFF